MTPPPRSGKRLGYPAAAAVFAVGMAGTTLPTPLYGLYREQLGFSELMVTVVFAVYALGVIATLLLAGNVSDEAGRRPVLLAALGFSAASALCFLFEGGLPALFAGRLLSGFAAGLLSGAATVTVMELAPPGRAARAGLAATAANMGGLGCGPLLSGLLAEYAPSPLRLPFVAHLALIAVAAVLTWFLPETVASARVRGLRLRPQGLAVPPAMRGVFTTSALAAFAGFSLLGLFTAVAPAFVAETLDVHNLALTGLVVFSVFLASTAGQALMGRVGERRPCRAAASSSSPDSFWSAPRCCSPHCPCWSPVPCAAAWARGWRSGVRWRRSARRPRPSTGPRPCPRSSSSPTWASPCPSSGSAPSPSASDCGTPD